MTALIYGSILVASAFALHVIIWRIHLPKRQTKTLLLLFFGVLSCGSLFLLIYAAEITIFGLHPPDTVLDFFQIWLYFISLTLAYMITYSAIEADSPSLLIILKIAEAGETGFDKNILNHELDDSVLILPRLNDLLVDKMAVLEEGKYRLKLKGILLARLFTFYRNIMRLEKGG